MVTSPDGATWTTQSTGINTSFYAMTWAGGAQGTGLLVAVGQGGLVRTSPDGETWTPRSSGTTANLHAVALTGAGTFLTAVGGLANGGSANATILTSAVSTTSLSPGTPRPQARMPLPGRAGRGLIEGYRPDGRVPAAAGIR